MAQEARYALKKDEADKIIMMTSPKKNHANKRGFLFSIVVHFFWNFYMI